ncbi:MAG TPA: NAD(P)-binding protein, partial [Oscillospiraceae bacterium]|nr:NAD(P)-binding protein [Oscillospiraceae bacterium]
MSRIVIIGGGISGLTAGIYARLAGFEAEICEKNAVPGGECTGWDRQGYHIDNCIHWMIGTAPGTELHKVWETTGALGTVDVRRRNVMYASEKDGVRLN